MCFGKHHSRTQKIIYIYIYIDYCENIYIAADMQTTQKIYLKISKILIYDFH
jgi:hypothetical protein